MVLDKTRRPTPAIMADDVDVLARLDNIPNYAPSNPAHSKDRLQTAIDEMRAAQATETRAAAAHDAARDEAVAKEWAVHDLATSIRAQVTAQFGKNSLEVQTIGRKREEEYKKRARKGGGGSGGQDTGTSGSPK